MDDHDETINFFNIDRVKGSVNTIGLLIILRNCVKLIILHNQDFNQN